MTGDSDTCDNEQNHLEVPENQTNMDALTSATVLHWK